MRMYEIDYEGGTPIDSYLPGGFRVGGELHRGGMVIAPGRRLDWAAADADALVSADFTVLVGLADEIDVLIVGAGPDIAPLPARARIALEEAGIGVEVMATPAACRTYNVLLAEGRRVAVALIPV